VLSQVKLIAEPWDLGPDGYLQGSFPYGFAEWNGRFRDGVRRFWRGDEGQLAETATRLAGSSDLFALSRRPPQASSNFVACHDGMTLTDLVTYAHKHNEANGEDGRDGPARPFAQLGRRGAHAARGRSALRERARRNLLATLVFSQGVPMLSHGESSPYPARQQQRLLQDNDITWVDWEPPDDAAQDLLAFARRVLALRRDNAVFRPARSSAASRSTRRSGRRDLAAARRSDRDGRAAGRDPECGVSAC